MQATRPVPKLAIALMAVMFVLAAGLVMSGQTPQPTDTLSALLSEVRALRIAMEQQAATVPRIQLSMARLNIEEQRMTRLSQQLDQVRGELSHFNMDASKTAAEAADLENQLRTERDEARLKELNLQLKDAKMRAEAAGANIEQLRLRENDLAHAVDAERDRWIDLNNQIDELERNLAPVRKQP